MATLIGLSIRVKLLRSLPSRYNLTFSHPFGTQPFQQAYTLKEGGGQGWHSTRASHQGDTKLEFTKSLTYDYSGDMKSDHFKSGNITSPYFLEVGFHNPTQPKWSKLLTIWIPDKSGVQMVSVLDIFNHKQAFSVQFLHHHSNTRPFDNRTQIYYLNTRIKRYSDGYCISNNWKIYRPWWLSG